MTQTARAWLSRQAPELVQRLQDSAGEPIDCDLLIVGSGYGAAVAAARAAGHRKPDGTPARIWVLERGSEYLPGMFPSRFSEIAGHVRFDTQDGTPARGQAEGLFDARLGKDVCVLLGNGLGGGSLINAGVMEKPADDVFDKHWPKAITRKELDAAYDRALEMLMPKPVPPGNECSKLHVLDSLIAPKKAERCDVTVHWQDERNAAGVQMRACTLCGDCFTGCNQSAKGSLDTNYLAFARARGVEMFCGGTVDTLARDGSFWRVGWRYTERKLRQHHGEVFCIRAERVVLAAGSLGSTEILLRSQPDGLQFSKALGRGFSANGDKITAGARHTQRVGAVGEQETDPADGESSRRVGPTITGLIRVPSTPGNRAFAVEEFSVPAGLRNVYGEIVAMLASLGKTHIGEADPYAVTDKDIEHISLYGSMGDDGADGKVVLAGSGAHGVRIDWPDLRSHTLYGDVGKWFKANLKTAVTVPTPDQSLSLASFILRLLPSLTVHPLGGCRMADSISDGVVDDCGRVFNQKGGAHEGLYVLDGSIVPRALGINPALTITALAERAMPQLLRDWTWQADGGDVSVMPPRPTGARRELPARDAVWSIRERVQGLFSIDRKTFYWARMEIEFEEVPGFRRALALTSRMLTIRSATMALYDAREEDDEFSIADPDTSEPASQPAFRATLAGSMELFAPVPGAPPGDERTRLIYRLSVQSVQDVRGQGDCPLAVGGRLEGAKVFGRQPKGAHDTSPWRQLSEMEMRYNGKNACRWSLDLADLAQRRDPLLRVMRLSSMPDAIDDAAAVVLYVLRRALHRLLGYWPEFQKLTPSEEGLSERWPVASETKVTPLMGGAQLTHYPPETSAVALPPVMLIHGLGSSGASYTDEALPNGLARTLCKSGRDVWVLDVRSSVGNEFARKDPLFEEAKRWTVDGVAQSDLPDAIDKILELTQQPKVDVFAHCMGAVMFCLAALGSDRMKGKVRAAVLSQVGPLIRFSPMNRFRGYVASYLQQFLRVDTFDTAPDFVSSIVDGKVKWEPRDEDDIAGQVLQLIVDLLLFTFPYPDDDKEAERQQSGKLKQSDFRRVRHRCDAIFGQLFELNNVSDEALLRLQAFLGWVMVPMLTQAIHFARRNMLTDASGRNAVLHQANFKERFDFPVLILHGRRNRVFDWRGSHDSWKLLNDLRKEATTMPDVRADSTHYGQGTRTQLAVLHQYGHLDCIIGKDAHKHVFPLVEAFFGEAQALPHKGSSEVRLQFEAPWIGPALGWLQLATDERGQPLWNIKVLIHAALRRTSTKAVIVMPMANEGGALVPRVDQARVIQSHPPTPRHFLLDLHIAEFALRKHFDQFSVLTMHDDGLSLQPLDERRQIFWSLDGDEANPGIQRALERWTGDPRNQPALAASIFTLAARLGAAADRGLAAVEPAHRLTFALVSCQYPPGLFDQRPAAAAYERLQADAAAADGPQFIVLCGDQVYVDETAGAFDPVAAPSGPSAVQDAAIDRSYELTWSLPAMRHTVARLPVIAMLDDHEVEDNWKGLNAEAVPPRDDVKRALGAYVRHQALLNPVRPLVQGGTIGSSFVNFPGGVPLFVLDTRGRRALRDASNITSAGIVPDAVMQSLCAQLEKADKAAPSSVKLIVSPSPILPPERFDPSHPAERLRSDSWSGYPASVVELLGFIRDKNIRRVVFLSGDAHLSSVCSLAFNGDHGVNQVVSVVSSGLYTPWPFANQRPDDLQLEGAVNLGWTQQPFDGTLKLHAQSAHNGHAVVSLVQVNGDAKLHVSMRAANGATTDCSVELT
jgi:cholesterol oxidase